MEYQEQSAIIKEQALHIGALREELSDLLCCIENYLEAPYGNELIDRKGIQEVKAVLEATKPPKEVEISLPLPRKYFTPFVIGGLQEIYGKGTIIRNTANGDRIIL